MELLAREIETNFGQVALVWTASSGKPVVQRIYLPGMKWAAEHLLAIKEQGPEMETLHLMADGIARFTSGEKVEFDLGLLALGDRPAFQRRVLLAEHAIPRGCISTYGRIAAELGVPGAARAVGNALARNPFPIVIPCHRALREDGSLGGFQGGIDMKRRLLAMEGHDFDGKGRILTRSRHY